MDSQRDERRHSGRPRRTSSRSPEGSSFRDRDDARSRRDRGGGARGGSRSRSALRRGGDRDMRRARGRSLSRRRDRQRSRSDRNKRRSRSPFGGGEQPRKKRSGFDQTEMLPENYAMQQLTNVKLQELSAMLPQAIPQPVRFNPRRIWDTLPTEVKHTNPEVETFLQQNEVHEHAANRLRALPLEVQTLVLERGSIRKSRDPTAVLMTRIRNAVTNPSQLWAPALGGLTGAMPAVGPQTQPGSNGATASAQPAENRGFSGVMSTAAGGQFVGDGNQIGVGAPAASQDGSIGEPFLSPLPPATLPPSGDSQSQGKSDDWDKPWTAWLYGSNKQQPNSAAQHEMQSKRESALAQRHEQVRHIAGEISSNLPAIPASQALTDLPASDASATEKVETEAERRKREEMQSSIAATIASLSAKVLPKEKATKFIGKEEMREAGTVKPKSGDGDSEEDMDIDDDVASSSQTDGAAALLKAQLRLPASLPLNPFRSKPHAAPVSQWTEPEALTQPGQEGAELAPTIDGMSRPADAGQTQSTLADVPQIPGNLQALAQQRDSTGIQDRMEAAKIPLGFRALRMQKGSAAEGSQHPTMRSGDGTTGITQSSTFAETGKVPEPQPQHQQQEQQHRSAPLNTSAAEPAAVGQLPQTLALAVPVQESPEEKKKRVEATARRAYALAALINYGLQDPDDEADLTKSVHAMAAATGDHAMAMTLWQHVTGKEPEQPQPVEAPAESSNSIVDFQNLSEQQQAEMQQAAAAAQYSQLWMQQQFLSQMALTDTERMMATGQMPTGSLDGELPKFSGKGKGKGDKATNWKLMLPGDWTCPGCGDHQFARNRICRYCGTAKPLF